MSNVFFTSDTHFGHTSLITRGLRVIPGVSSIEDHDKTIVERWNRVVGPRDTVYHMGDFAWRSVKEYRDKLNGFIHLVLGNHDRLSSPEKKLFESISEVKSIRCMDQKIYLCHYAFRVWNLSHHGSWHLYGHSHGNLADDPQSRSFDVGVDCWDFTPLSFEQVSKKIGEKNWVPVDHHK